ncbi:transcription factor PAR2-like [Cucurbita moschata]|uniref:Transcription factor PAR2-like n=1 Tax=Cucurbita moschata TaxID=3662 RepID=A0A6J1GYH6_CUCMO|nr:transcription factor PAR2-like [Cucurbita moschata]
MEYYNCDETRGIAKVKWQRRGRRGGRHGGASVHMKLRKLQRIIPGGRRLKPDRLFLKTADYIMQLRSQVHVLNALSKIYDPQLSRY